MSTETPVEIPENKGEKKEFENDNLRCRFYENQYPEPDEVVIANVTEIAEMGAYVTLLEYDNAEGMILLSELSRRRIRSINRLVRVNRTEVVMVIRVDKDKGYIDLSKRQVTAEDIVKCEERYNKAKAVHGVLKYVALMNNTPLKELYENIGWPLYRKYGHAFDAFKLAVSGEDIFEGLTQYKARANKEEDSSAPSEAPQPGLECDPRITSAIMNYVKQKLAPQPVKIRADIEVTCFEYEGIDAVKAALSAGEAVSTPEIPIKIKLIAPPMFVMTTMTLDKDLGIEKLNQAMEVIKNAITASGGVFEVKMLPRALTQREETELLAMMDRLALEADEADEVE